MSTSFAFAVFVLFIIDVSVPTVLRIITRFFSFPVFGRLIFTFNDQFSIDWEVGNKYYFEMCI